MALVSIILPVYNGEQFLALAIRSVLNQSFSDWELLIVNDGSTDTTKHIIESFHDQRIQLISQENKGVAAARNVALSRMSGKYFTFLDADDTLPPESLMIRYRFAESHKNIDIVAGSVNFLKEGHLVRRWSPSFQGNPFLKFLRLDESVYCHPSLFIRRKNYTYQFDEKMSHVEDWTFFVNISRTANKSYSFVSDEVYNYTIHPKSAMNNLTGLEVGYWLFFQRIKDYPESGNHLAYLKFKIIRIMTLSYLARGCYRKALSAVLKGYCK